MPSPLLFDVESLDLTRTVMSRERIYAEILPQRDEFALLDGVCFFDARGTPRLVSFCDIREDAWWTRGHIPGRPLMPGVLMIEAAAQTATVGIAMLDMEAYRRKGFMGFGAVDACKFRGAVVPPARLLMLCVEVENRSRRFSAVTQGLVDGKLIFEAQVTGLVMR